MLECKNLSKRFGGVIALNDFSCKLDEKEILGLIGPNGSGKTTLLNLIMNIYQPSSGYVLFRGEKITGLEPHKIIRLGISKTNQIPKFFLDMNLLQNVAVAGIFGGNLEVEESMTRAAELLEFVGLSKKKNDSVGKLTGIELRLLELARSLITKPKLLLLDEIAAGTNELEIKQMQQVVRQLREERVTIIWVEHIIEALVGVCDRLICLNEGRKIAEGKTDEVIKDPKVIEAYLGERTCLPRIA